MKSQSIGTHKDWTETAYHEESETCKQTHVVAHFHYEGGLEGESEVRYLMAYTDEGPVTYVGLERFVGMLDGRFGSFVLQHTGMYQHGESNTLLEIVPFSGTGDLTGLSGKGAFLAGAENGWPVELDWEITE
jgi:hypothetical protein